MKTFLFQDLAIVNLVVRLRGIVAGNVLDLVNEKIEAAAKNDRRQKRRRRQQKCREIMT
jgi:hypothetical protein